jgi:N-acetylneuraminate 9-O-acetyltransferase
MTSFDTPHSSPLLQALGLPSSKSNETDPKKLNFDADLKHHKLMSFLNEWKSRKAFLYAQLQVAVIVIIAYIGNNWPVSYPRNDNHDPSMFWVMNGALFVAMLATLKHDPNASSRGVQLLSRPQNEEWKGWMQWAFIMYHYYRVYYVYNEIRVFVSAYVWMTGFGNFIYFEKKQDFSMERIISMWLRINYFPILLCFCLDVKLELYYVVPLHTAGFFITMATCYVATLFKTNLGFGYWAANGCAVAISLAVHVGFYETQLVDSLLFFSKEYHFRFQADKYSAWVGILSAMFWKKFSEHMQVVYAETPPKALAMYLQRAAGVFLIWFWYYGFGYMTDKFMYNPLHPYIFWMPVAGWIMIRNSSKYLCELHSTALEFLGKITLETYVLQFHVFMCNNVQNIPVVIPGATSDGPYWLKAANMLLCGSIFVPLALWARKVTVTTQTSVTELAVLIMNCYSPPKDELDDGEEKAALTKTVDEEAVAEPKTENI